LCLKPCRSSFSVVADSVLGIAVDAPGPTGSVKPGVSRFLIWIRHRMQSNSANRPKFAFHMGEANTPSRILTQRTRPRDPSHQSRPSTTARVSLRKVLDTIPAYYGHPMPRVGAAAASARTPPLRFGRKRFGPPPSAPKPSPQLRDGAVENEGDENACLYPVRIDEPHARRTLHSSPCTGGSSMLSRCCRNRKDVKVGVEEIDPTTGLPPLRLETSHRPMAMQDLMRHTA
jgi:hypothetical protein